MKVTTLALKNVGVFKDVTLELDRPLALIFGENATGKTTLATALEIGVTGKATRFEGYRMSLGALIGPAADRAEISETVQANGKPLEIRRKIGARGLATTINGKDISAEVYDFFSPKEMCNPARAWRAVATVGGVLDADDAKVKALLLDLVDPSVPRDLIKDLPWKTLALEPVEAIAGLAQAYDVAYAKRKTAKATLASIKVPAFPAEVEQNLALIETRLGELRAEERALVAATSQAAGKKEGERAALVTRRAALDDRLGKAEVRRNELGAPAGYQDVIANAERQKEQLAVARRQNADTHTAIGKLEGELETLRGQAKKLATLGKACVISADLECPLKPAQRTKQDEEWKRRLDVMTADITAHRKKLVEVAGDGAWDKAIREARSTLDALERADAVLADTKRELADVDAALAKLPAEAPAMPDAPDPLQALRTRIQNGEGNLSRAREINKGWADYRLHQAAHEEGTKTVEDLERLCEALGPRGVGEKLLAARLGEVRTRLNAVLEKFKLSIEFQSEPWALKFNGRPTVLLSASERFRAGLAFQVAVAAVTGAKWLVLDGIDILDKANRGALFEILQAAVKAGDVEQAIVLATTLEQAAINPGAFKDGPFRAFLLTAPGEVRRLE